MKTIIFTDLGGTLLDPVTRSFEKVRPCLEILKKKKIPIVFCTAKSRAENEYYQKRTGIKDPFVAETGGAIFISKNYFSFPYDYHKSSKEHFIIELGVSYKKVREVLKEVRNENNFKIKAFGDMSAEEVAKDSELSVMMARLAKKKYYSESFDFDKTERRKKVFFQKVEKLDLKISHGGRYYNMFGKDSDKGKATAILKKLFKKEFKNIQTIGIGDALNDLSMLEVVDIPVLVRNKVGKWNPNVKLPNVYKMEGIGPDGWIQAINKFVLNKHA